MTIKVEHNETIKPNSLKAVVVVDIPDYIDDVSKVELIYGLYYRKRWGNMPIDPTDILEYREVYPLKLLPDGLDNEYHEFPKWIPVGERLPKDRDWYLGVFKETDTEWINPLPYICDYVGHQTKATTKDGWIIRGCTDVDNPSPYFFGLKCIAWMPLPEPYAEETSKRGEIE